MKPWGSQVTFLVFQTFFRPHTPSPQVEGCAGEKMSAVLLDSAEAGWVHSSPPTPSGCTRLFGFRPLQPAVPVIRIRRVAHSFRPSWGSVATPGTDKAAS